MELRRLQDKSIRWRMVHSLQNGHQTLLFLGFQEKNNSNNYSLHKIIKLPRTLAVDNGPLGAKRQKKG